MTKILRIAVAGLMLATTITSCQKGDLTSDPNAISADATVPVSLILNHITATFIRQEEMPLGNDATYNKNGYKAGQYMVSNYDKYWGTNEYSWSYSAHAYDILKYTVQLEIQAKNQFGATNNKYLALAKFFRAYSAIWLAQRVGDIPMSQAGDAVNFPKPKFDTQHDVYKNALQLLDDANSMFNTILTPATQNTAFSAGGDIFGFTNLQWQKLINTYRLRVLISLSKRADDNTDLNIKTQFATILGNSTTYPIMTANSDNMVYRFNAVNLYPNFASGSNSYNNFLFVGKPVLDITTSTSDPRTFLIATPVDKSNLSSFASYQGAPTGTSMSTLFTSSFSNFNGLRYFGSNSGANAEPFIFIGYPEMCFNIAEAINRGWVGSLGAADAQTWYNKGITASFANFGLAVNGSDQSVKISDVAGNTLGNVTTNYAVFLSNVAYNTADKTAALTQILTQKYVATFVNSGWEAFYNYRRTGIPAFATGASNTGYGTVAGQIGIIPRRFLYPLDEINANNDNYKTSIGTQFGGTDDVTKDTWLTK